MAREFAFALESATQHKVCKNWNAIDRDVFNSEYKMTDDIPTDWKANSKTVLPTIAKME